MLKKKKTQSLDAQLAAHCHLGCRVVKAATNLLRTFQANIVLAPRPSCGLLLWRRGLAPREHTNDTYTRGRYKANSLLPYLGSHSAF